MFNLALLMSDILLDFALSQNPAFVLFTPIFDLSGDARADLSPSIANFTPYLWSNEIQ